MTADHLDRINPAQPRMAGIDGEPHVRPGHGKEAIEILLPLDDRSQMVVIRAAHPLTRQIIGHFGQSPAELLPRRLVEPRCPRKRLRSIAVDRIARLGDHEHVSVHRLKQTKMRLHRGNLGLGGAVKQRRRSEEHTSELQSLMRISYAVFCLKKKNEYIK